MSLNIVASKLTVAKEKNIILNGLDFIVNAGTLTGLIGPSGSGKTTLMRTIVGIQIPTSGSLRIGDRETGSKELRSRIGYMTQTASVYEDLTVAQNLHYFAVLKRASKQSVKEVLKQIDLVKQTDQVVSTLSGGQRARVSLGIALIGNPDVLVLDEPTVGLDPLLRQNLWDMFRTLSESGKTIIISSHVMDEADRCDNVLLLRDGDLLWSSSREELLKTTDTTDIGAAFLVKVEAA